MRRGGLLIVVLGLGAGALGLLLSREGAREEPSAVGPSAEREERAGGPALEGERVRAPGTAAAATVDAAEPSPPSAGLGAVDVGVRDEEGRPLEGARVRLRPTRDGAPPLEANTASNGSARFPGVEAGEAWLHVDAQGFEKGGRGLTVKPEAGARAEIVLSRLLPVSGVVLLPGGEPAPGAEVLVRRGGSLEGRTEMYLGEDFVLARTQAQPDGSFHLGLAPRVLVTLEAALAPHAGAAQPLRPRAAVEGLVLRLGVGGALRGIVLAPDGAPSRGAQVFVVPAEVPELLGNPRAIVGPGGGMFWSSLDEDPSGGTEFEGEGRIHRALRTTTDEEGRFRLVGVALPARLCALAQGADGARGAGPAVELSEAVPEGASEVRLEPRVTLFVRVRGPTGEPATAELALEGAREHFLEPRVEPEPEPRGAPHAGPPAPWVLEASSSPDVPTPFFPGLVGGDYVLRAQIQGCLPLRLPVVLPPAGSREIEIRGQRGRSLEVRVVDPSGAPVVGAGLQLMIEAAPGIEAQSIQAWGGDAGRHVFEGLQDAAGSLHVGSETHVSRRLEGVRPGPEPLRVVLEPLPLLTCRFVLDGVNQTHDYVWVEERSEGVERMRTGQVGADGVFRYRVQTVEVESLFVLAPWEGARVVLGRHRLGAGEVKDLGEVRVDRGREIRGRILDRAGMPAAGVTVRATLVGLADEADGMRRGPPEAPTDVEGRFVLRGVHRGPAVLRTTHPTWAPLAVPEDGGGAEVALVVVPGAFLEGLLLPRDAEAGRRGWIELLGPTGARTVVLPDAAGAFRAGPLPPGTQRVLVARPPGGSTTEILALDLAPGETRRVEWPPP